jgi:hypothetical protein
VPTPVYRTAFRETLPLGDDAIAQAMATLPLAGSKAAPGVVAIPRLTLEQYASLCVDLAEDPSTSAANAAHIPRASKAAHDALDAHWRERMEADPATRAAFEAAVARYTRYRRETRM